jgi:hypothetical protein
MVWFSFLLPVELAERLERVIETTNQNRPIKLRFVSKSGFARTCIADGVTEAERVLGIVPK